MEKSRFKHCWPFFKQPSCQRFHDVVFLLDDLLNGQRAAVEGIHPGLHFRRGIRHVSVHQLYELFVLDVVDQSVGDRIASLVCPPDIEFFLPFWGRSCSLGLNLGLRFGRGGTVRRRLLGCGLCQSSLTSDVNGRQWRFLGWAGQRTAEKHGIDHNVHNYIAISSLQRLVLQDGSNIMHELGSWVICNIFCSMRYAGGLGSIRKSHSIMSRCRFACPGRGGCGLYGRKEIQAGPLACYMQLEVREHRLHRCHRSKSARREGRKVPFACQNHDQSDRYTTEPTRTLRFGPPCSRRVRLLSSSAVVISASLFSEPAEETAANS